MTQGTEAERPGADSAPDRSPSPVDLLWSEFKETGSVDLRNSLTVHYSSLAKFVAFRVLASAPSHIDSADLVSYGVIGLIDAIERFDPGRGIRFESYAIRRIRGAILDGLRRADWAPRSVRRKARLVEQASSDLVHILRRTPTEDEVAASLDMTPADYRHVLGDISMAGVVTFEEVLRSDQAESGSVREPTEGLGPDPATSVESKLYAESVRDAVRAADERERTVLMLYYYENLTLAEIGNVLGVTEGRVSQIHTKAVLRLRRRLTGSEGRHRQVG